MKSAFRSASYGTIDTHQSATPQLPLGQGLAFVAAADKIFLNGMIRDCYDDEGMEKDGVPRIMEGDIDWFNEDCHSFESAIESIISAEYTQKHDPGFPNETFKSLNAHIISGIIANQDIITPTSTGAILCAGNGEDINRLFHYTVDTVAHLDLIGYSPLNSRAHTNLLKSGTMAHYFPQHLHNVDFGLLQPSYDFIVCHHGLHHILATPEGEDAFVLLLKKLKPGGRLIGDYVNFLGLVSTSQFSYQPTRGVELVDVDYSSGYCALGSGERPAGVMTVRVRDKIWKDPILTEARLDRLVTGAGFVLNLLPGNGAFMHGKTLRGTPLVAPPSVRHASTRPEARIITYVEIARGTHNFVFDPRPLVPESSKAYWAEKKDINENVAWQLSFPINKGQPLQPTDVHYAVYETSLYSEKTNGVSGRCVILEGAVWLTFEWDSKPVIFCGTGISHAHRPVCSLQVEVVGWDPSTRLFADVVVLEPIHLGPGTPSGFFARLTLFDSVLLHTPGLQSLLSTKAWYGTWEEAKRDPSFSSWEGAVIMSYSAPPPSSSLPRTARFIKREYTIDIPGPHGVVEVRRGSGEYVRDRKDKRVPNNPLAVRWAMKGVTLDEFSFLLGIPISPQAMQDTLNAYISSPPEDRNVVMGAGLLMLLKYPHVSLSPSYEAHRSLMMSELAHSDIWQDALGQMCDFSDSSLPDEEVPLDANDEYNL